MTLHRLMTENQVFLEIGGHIDVRISGKTVLLEIAHQRGDTIVKKNRTYSTLDLRMQQAYNIDTFLSDEIRGLIQDVVSERARR